MAVDFAKLNEQARTAWSLGNYAELARVLEPAARELVDACAISAGQEVLDVAAGNGNVAILAARAGATVVASDLTPAMLDEGRRRSEAEGVEIEWVEADAAALAFDDRRFDRVVSSFGAMLAPRAERVAAELFRVTRPGGTVGMGNWTPDGFMGEMFAVGRDYQPLSDGVEPNTEWGRPEVVEARLDGLASYLRLESRTLPFRFESPDAMLDWFEENAGPARAARRSMPAGLHAEMRRRTIDVAARHNRAADGSVAIEAEYLLVVARKPGSP